MLFPGVEIICYNQAASAKARLAVPLGPWDSVLSGGGVAFLCLLLFLLIPFSGILQGLCACLWMPAPLAVDESSVAFSDSPVLRSFSVLRRAVSAARSAGSPGFRGPGCWEGMLASAGKGVPRGDGSERSAVQSSPVRAAVPLLRLSGWFTFPSALRRPVCPRGGPAYLSPPPGTHGPEW